METHTFLTAGSEVPSILAKCSSVGPANAQESKAIAEAWEQAIAVMKQTASIDRLNFWQWAWYWQRTPAFPGAPAGFGVLGSIYDTPRMIDKIIEAGGGDGFRMISAEEWISFYRQAL